MAEPAYMVSGTPLKPTDLVGLSTGLKASFLRNKLAAQLGLVRIVERLPASFDINGYKDVVIFDVVRPADLLLLRFSFIGYAMSADGTLTRTAGDKPAYACIAFQPQHVREPFVDASDPANATIDLSANAVFLTCRSELLKEASKAVGADLIDKLSFRLPKSLLSLPFDLERLLDWSSWVPVLPQFPTEPVTGDRAQDPPSVSPYATALHIPLTLTVAPTPEGIWVFARKPVNLGSTRTELWRARLESLDGRPALTAHAWLVEPVANSEEFPMLKRHAGLTAAQAQLIVGAGIPIAQALGAAKSLAPIPVKALVLSALGARLEVRAKFANFDWDQDVAFGRDQYCRTVTRGVLYPWGLSATLTLTDERRISLSQGLSARGDAVLERVERRLRIEASRTYPGDIGNASPFARVTLLSSGSVTIDPHSDNFLENASKPLEFTFMVEDVLGTACELTGPAWFVTTQDGIASKNGRPVVVPYATSGPAIALDRRAADLAHPTYKSNSVFQSTSLSIRAVAIAGGKRSWGAHGPPTQIANIVPVLAFATIKVPALCLINNEPEGHSTIAFDLGLLRSAQLPKGAFALFVDEIPLSRKPLSVALHFGGTARSGGLALPALPVSTLSIEHGLTGASADEGQPKRSDADGLMNWYLNDLRRDITSDAVRMCLAQAKILGGIPLASVLPASLERPVVNTFRTDQEWGAEFKWDIALRLDGVPTSLAPEPSRGNQWLRQIPGKEGRLSVYARVSQGSVTALSRLESTATLSDVELQLPQAGDAALIAIPFSRIKTNFTQGSKPDISVDLDPAKLRLLGDLAFLNDFVKYVPQDGFSNPPAIHVMPWGIEAGYTLQLPDFAFGVFCITDLTFAAQFILHFDNSPASIALSFGTIHKPFLMSVYGIAGGGHLKLDLDSSGLRGVDASLDFGGMVAFSVAGIVSGKIAAVGGLRFTYTKDGPVVASGFQHVSGGVEVLGLVGISIDVMVALTYDSNGPSFSGSAEVEVEIDVLFFSKTVGFTVEYTFVGSKRSRSIESVTSAMLDQGPAHPGLETRAAADIPHDATEFARYAAAFG